MSIDFDTLVHSLHVHWATCLAAGGGLTRPLTPVEVAVVDVPELPFTAQIYPGEVARVEFAHSFLAGLVEPLSVTPVRRACLDGLEAVADSPDTDALVTEICLELMVSVVLLHELFHILCGHLDEAVGGKQGVKFSEAALGLTTGVRVSGERPTGMPEDELLGGYFRELEADNCALQALAQLPSPPNLRLFLTECLEVDRDRCDDPEDLILGQLTGIEKVFAYRFLLVSVWQVIQALEAARAEDVRRGVKGHPYPGARLLAAVLTLLESFVGVHIDKSGDCAVALDAHQAREGRVFLDHVLKPVLVRAWPVGEDTLGVSGIEEIPAWVVLEVSNLMLGREPVTPSGQQLFRLDAVRKDTLERLAPFKYFS